LCAPPRNRERKSHVAPVSASRFQIFCSFFSENPGVFLFFLMSRDLYRDCGAEDRNCRGSDKAAESLRACNKRVYKRGWTNLHGDRVVLPTTAVQNQTVVTDAMQAYIQHATRKRFGRFFRSCCPKVGAFFLRRGVRQTYLWLMRWGHKHKTRDARLKL